MIRIEFFMKLLVLLLAFVSVTALSGCSGSQAAPQQPEEVVLDKDYNSKTGEIVIDDSAFNDKSVQVSTDSLSKDEGARTLTDKSRIETLVDGFGNKSETRYFPGHPRIKFVLVRTGIDKTRTVTVYGYGDARNVDELGNIALTASADELADKAKLYNTRGLKNSKPENFMKREETPQPLPSSQFPLINKTAQPQIAVNNP